TVIATTLRTDPAGGEGSDTTCPTPPCECRVTRPGGAGDVDWRKYARTLMLAVGRPVSTTGEDHDDGTRRAHGTRPRTRRGMRPRRRPPRRPRGLRPRRTSAPRPRRALRRVRALGARQPRRPRPRPRRGMWARRGAARRPCGLRPRRASARRPRRPLRRALTPHTTTGLTSAGR